jgi:hypothetical protein
MDAYVQKIEIRPAVPALEEDRVVLDLSIDEALALLAVTGRVIAAPTDSLAGTNFYSQMFNAMQRLPQFSRFGSLNQAVYAVIDEWEEKTGRTLKFSTGRTLKFSTEESAAAMRGFIDGAVEEAEE